MRLKRYRENLRRAGLRLAPILLVAVVVSLGVDIWLGDARAQAQSQTDALGSVEAMLSLALSATRMALPVIAALVAVPLLLSNLARDLYGVEVEQNGHNTLNRLVFGRAGRGPSLLAKEGELVVSKGAAVQKTGGPASLVVHSDTAVVTEQCGRLKRVLGAGRAQLGRFERVWETIDLRPQHWVHEVFALTKEGIPISCEADISFRIADRMSGSRAAGETEPASAKTPYPYAEEAVLRAATSKRMLDSDGDNASMPWTGRVVLDLMERTLRDILAEYRLDWLIASSQPDQDHPRERIRRRLERELGDKVHAVGATILDVELGEIRVSAENNDVSDQLSEIVSSQRIRAWQAELQTRALASRVEGEAELLRMDAARIQAQAEMVVTLVETLQSTITSEEGAESYILALRFVESLRWMSYSAKDQEFMPPEAMRTLKRLQAMLASRTDPPGMDLSS